jgi:N,N-dimethylformamidase
MVHVSNAAQFDAELVRLTGPDDAETAAASIPVDSTIGGTYPARRQKIVAGSFVVIEDHAGLLDLTGSFTLHAFIWPTAPARGFQGIVARWSDWQNRGYALVINAEGRVCLWLGRGDERVEITAPESVRDRVWYSIGGSFDSKVGLLALYQRPIVSSTKSRLGLLSGLDAASYLEHRVPAGVTIAEPDATHSPFFDWLAASACGASTRAGEWLLQRQDRSTPCLRQGPEPD